MPYLVSLTFMRGWLILMILFNPMESGKHQMFLMFPSNFYHFMHSQWPWQESQDQLKAKPAGFIFSHTFQLIRDEVWYGFEAIQYPGFCFLVRSYNRREITTDLLTSSKTVKVGMHSDVYELISFKGGMMMYNNNNHHHHHVKHAPLRWTSANTKIQNTCKKTSKTALSKQSCSSIQPGSENGYF